MKLTPFILISITVLLAFGGIGAFYLMRISPRSFPSYSFFSMEEEKLERVTFEKEYAAGYVAWEFEGPLIETLNGFENAAGDQIFFDDKGRFRRFVSADLSGDGQRCHFRVPSRDGV